MKKLKQYLDAYDGYYNDYDGELKEFIVFAFHQYYPQGGLSDISASFDTLEEAKAYIENDFYPEQMTRHGKQDKRWIHEYYQVISKADWNVVWQASVKHREIST